MRNKYLLNMLRKLATNEATFISFEQVEASFKKKNVRYDTGNGKWIEKIKCGIDSDGNDYIILKGFMPRKSVYSRNYQDCTTVLTVITGKIRDTVFKMNRTSSGQFIWRDEIVHAITAIEDSTWFALYTKTMNPDDIL